MALIEKLSLLNLDKKEEVKAKQKFLATISLISEDELKERLNFLKSKNVFISKAKEIKVLLIPIEELAKKFSILDEIHETDLYLSEPSALLLNVIDIYKKIKYCIQNNIEYKWKEEEKLKYADFLKSEGKWKNFLEQREDNNLLDKNVTGLDESLVTLEPFEEKTVSEQPTYDSISQELLQNFTTPSDLNPNLEDNLVSFSEITTPQIEEPKKFEDSISQNDITEDFKTTNLADIRAELERELQELDKLKSSQTESEEIIFNDGLDDNIINFNDIEPESYGMGGRVA